MNWPNVDGEDFIDAELAATILFNAPDEETAEAVLRASRDGIAFTGGDAGVGVAVALTWEAIDHGSDVIVETLPHTGDEINTGSLKRALLDNMNAYPVDGAEEYDNADTDTVENEEDA